MVDISNYCLAITQCTALGTTLELSTPENPSLATYSDLYSTACDLLGSVRLNCWESAECPYHIVRVWNPYPTEELVGAEYLLMSGNEVPFDQEYKQAG